MKATEIFTPGAFPNHTYIERGRRGYETQLRNAVDVVGQVVSLAGPSKSGKTVLVEQVIGKDSLIAITGAGIEQSTDVWERVLDQMDAPSETNRVDTSGGKGSVSLQASGETGIPFVAKGSLKGSTTLEDSVSRSVAETRRRQGLAQVVKEIGGSDFVILIDDFHYMPRAVQENVARQIKAAIRDGVKVITVSVPHRSDDVVRANPELRGRAATLDVDYWQKSDLKRISETGFGLINVSLPEDIYNAFAEEAAGSPQLMQTICLHACFGLNLREKQADWRFVDVDQGQMSNIFESASTVADFRSLVDVLDSGPKTRGTDRKTFKFFDGTQGDVYRCILKAISTNPPRLAFNYDDITERIRNICTDETPSGSSIIGSCQHIAKLALDKFPTERVIDWDDQKFILDIPDPYLLFYLRWSNRLLEPEK